MKQTSIIDIISPVMVGPSSSHTAGAVRLGLLAKNIYNEIPDKVVFKLYNSYAQTGKGHGTDKGLLAGVLGLSVEFQFYEDFNRHPNAVEIIFEGRRNMVISGNSVGAGEVEITNIDGFSVSLTGKYNTLLLVYKDVPNMISRVTNSIHVNIDASCPFAERSQ